MQDDPTVSTDTTPPGFDTLGLNERVLEAVRDVGYESPSAIQLAAIPPLVQGRDLLGQAQTGTGKTAAFALPLLSQLDLALAQPQVLVLTPTRELAIQVAEAMQTYARRLKGFHVLPIYGGQGMDFQLRQLRRGVHVVVGTPGRIQDHLRRGTLALDKLRAVVIDEADEMLRMGFIDEVETILESTPAEKQVALFSATLPDRIRKIAHRYLRDPVEVKIRAKTATVAAIDQRYVEIRGFNKLEALTRIVETETFDAMLVFVRTRMAVNELTQKLEARGLAAAALSGEMSQVMRERTITQLKNGKLDIVVATDVAARGLDVERITHVINYDIPHDVEGYIHRIGRTGRAGRAGHAILFVMPRERRMLTAIERATRQTVTPMRLPTSSDVAERRIAELQQVVADVITEQDLDFFTRLVESFGAGLGKSPLEIAAALAYLAQRERPLQAQPEPREDFRDRRPERSSERRPESTGGKRDRATPGGPSVRYRVAVGRTHGVQPGNLVGAIANEAGIDSTHIGRIELFDDYSTVELPEGMPPEIERHLRDVWVCGQKLALQVDGGPPERARVTKRKPAASPSRAPARTPSRAPARKKPVPHRKGPKRPT